ncbi:MAG: nitrous oxide reductase accessory protein NosL [Bacteroidota bacterium]|nr:nitrous oxide reductase accessory protein NosL [Bacteroidota bacterium]
MLKPNKFFNIGCLLLLFLLNSCSKNPEPIVYGDDNCEYCKMLITNPAYGTELVTDKGKIYKYDSIECLAAYSAESNKEEIASLWVTDFGNPGNLINLDSALFLRSEKLRSPMGLNLTAFSDEKTLQDIISKHSGERITWDEIAEYVREEWDE